MFIRMVQTLGTPHGAYKADGTIYDVIDAQGAVWIRQGLAVRTLDAPPLVEQLLARLDDGAGEPCVFLPFLGEFGHMIMSHVRIVHFHRAAHKLVCCRPHERVLFPSAAGFFHDWTDPVADADRMGSWRITTRWPDIEQRFPQHKPVAGGSNLTPLQEIFPIRPFERIPFAPRRRGLVADVVLGTRRRDFCPERNWAHWQRLADALADAGHSFAVAGVRPTTQDLAGQRYHTADYDTDAAVELMQSCKLYIGTDTGVSHMASTVGCQMLLFREEQGGSRDLTGRMAAVNPDRVDVLPATAWATPAAVINAALATLDTLDGQHRSDQGSQGAAAHAP